MLAIGNRMRHKHNKHAVSCIKLMKFRFRATSNAVGGRGGARNPIWPFDSRGCSHLATMLPPMGPIEHRIRSPSKGDNTVDAETTQKNRHQVTQLSLYVYLGTTAESHCDAIAAQTANATPIERKTSNSDISPHPLAKEHIKKARQPE